MATMGVEPVMVDTNVWVYLSMSGMAEHAKAKVWVSKLMADGIPLHVSPQILREYMSVTTRITLFQHPLTPARAAQLAQDILMNASLLDETSAVAAQLREPVRRHKVQGKQIHDANIVATMLVHDIKRLVTFNPADFRRYTEIELATAP
jgi:toxin-antitoxin system PIN domain toxin